MSARTVAHNDAQLKAADADTRWGRGGITDDERQSFKGAAASEAADLAKAEQDLALIEAAVEHWEMIGSGPLWAEVCNGDNAGAC